jgi:hypothetical protein
MVCEMVYLYCEPVRGNVIRFKVQGEDDVSFILDVPSVGSVQVPKDFTSGGGVAGDFPLGKLWLETEEWEIKYQDSLSRKVSQQPVTVYMVSPIKRGKFNSRVLVIDEAGATYHGMAPTIPLPVFGQELHFLRMDLEPVSLVPARDLLERVMRARRE